MDGIDPGEMQWSGDHRDDEERRRGRIEEHPSDQQDNIDDEQQHQRVGRERQELSRHRLRDLLDRHDPAEQRRCRDNDEDRRGALKRLEGGVDKVLPGQRAIDDGADEDDVRDRDRRGFGGREEAEQHAGDEQHRRQQCG